MTAPIADYTLAHVLGLTGRILSLAVESDALQGNALGDPTTRLQAVYLPPDYDREPHATYPVLYYLPGYGSTVQSTLAVRPWEQNLFQRCDRLIRTEQMPAALVVVVDGWTRLGGSQYVDSVHHGAYATYITREVVAAVDRAFRTRRSPYARGVFGHSSGGFGALHLAMRYPGVFGAVASHSGDSYFPYATLPAFEKTRRVLHRYATLADFATAFFAQEHHTGDVFEAMMTLAYASAYSPRAALPYAIDLPFSLESGELDATIFDRWLTFDPVENVLQPDAVAALKPMALCYLDCGIRDEWALNVGARLFADRARTGGVAVLHEEFDGAHSKIKHRFERSMPLMLQALLEREKSPSM